MNGILMDLARKVKEWWELEKAQPLKVSIMGQTGVGKSSLINTLFNADLPTNAIGPGTLETHEYPVTIHGNKLIFYDLPGIGESRLADRNYFEKYKEKLLGSDIVIWAIHADSRSFTFDQNALQEVLDQVQQDERTRIMSKIIFVLTKADLLIPSPWVLTKMKEEAVFTPRGKTVKLLEEKELYFQRAFILPFGEHLRAQTYSSKKFRIRDAHLDYDKYTVYYKGFFDRERLVELQGQYPQHKDVFSRLYDNYRIIPCSSQFRFNLDLLMRVIVDKLETHAIGRFGKFKFSGTMNRVPFLKAKHFRNIVILDDASKHLYDISEME